MDFAEEQRNEVEALESIYLDDLQIIEEDPWSFTIYVECDQQEDNPKFEACSVQFRFTLTPCYPETPPEIQIIEKDNLSDNDISDIMEIMKEQADENSGMAMVFTLLSAAKDKMAEIAENILIQKEDEIQKLKRLAEERDKAIRLGTPVTVANFLKWKAEFEQEQSAAKKRSKNNDSTSTKLTGRQLFESDSSLKNSDASFMQDGDVRIDESLFEDLDGLDIEEDMEDD
ncbi:RWD domain-containing protein 1 [Trichoplax sp. H2]|nr:RWD domain-containing protein 1 [Trichoplax sp. H2]|eukprot:RDD37798.1 RWD domain-containing protein 1 [Trichoplax sp. H2]